MKLKLPIIIVAVVVAAGAGLYLSGMIGGTSGGPLKKHAVAPVTMSAPFTVNTTDTDAQHFAVFNVALKLAPMDEAHWANWSGASAGGHGGSGEAPGPIELASYAKYRSAIVEVASGMSMETLSTQVGKESLKKQLLDRFAEIAEVDEAEAKSSPENPATVGIEPPYHVDEVFFTDFALQ